MALNDVTFEKKSGGIQSIAPGKDHVSGLIFYTTKSNPFPEDAYPIGSVKDLDGFGVDSETGSDYAVLHYHISEFFRMNPKGKLWVTVDTFNSDFEEIDEMQRASNGEIRQIGVYTSEDYSTSHITKIDAVADALEEEHMPVSVIYSANLFGADVPYDTVGESLANQNCRKVSVVIGQSASGKGNELYNGVDETTSTVASFDATSITLTSAFNTEGIDCNFINFNQDLASVITLDVENNDSVIVTGKVLAPFLGEKIVINDNEYTITSATTVNTDDTKIIVEEPITAIISEGKLNYKFSVGVTKTSETVYNTGAIDCTSILSNDTTVYAYNGDDQIKHHIQSPQKSIGCVGTALGTVSSASVHENIGWVQKFNLGGEFQVPALADGTLVRELTTTTLDKINTNKFIFIRKHIGKTGAYFNDSFTCMESGDFSDIERNRTIDKAIRDMRTDLLPQLNSPLTIDSETGGLAIDSVKFFENLAGQSLERMLKKGELSDYKVAIDPAQEVLSTSTLEVDVQLIPRGTARWIKVSVGFAAKLK